MGALRLAAAPAAPGAADAQVALAANKVAFEN